MNKVEKWNSSHKNIPLDKSFSSYAVEKEMYFPKNSEVLDLGGGTGADSIYFLSKGHKVVLLDISDYALRVAKDKAAQNNFKIETKQIELTEGILPFSDSVFDIVYSRLALHYFDKITTQKLFIEINRILKPGGRCFITLKSPLDVSEMEFLKQNAIEIEPGVFNESGDVKSRFTITQLKGIIDKAAISSYQVLEYTEDLGNRIDKTKSGNTKMLLNEVTWIKV